MSLPTRERGLKFDNTIICNILHASLPTRERGLKYSLPLPHTLELWSLPTRERGLKLKSACYINQKHSVAPYTGAWIEMSIS